MLTLEEWIGSDRGDSSDEENNLETHCDGME